MKTMLLFLLVLISFDAYAVRVIFQAEKNKVITKATFNLKKQTSVGELSYRILERSKQKKILTFQGSELGIESINHYDNKVDVLPGNEIKAYGFCYALNGKVPETMPADTMVTKNSDVVYWFYAYAHYKNGEWIAQCKKAF